MTIIAMLVIPLPTLLVDFLIGLNIVLSALVFLSSFYIDRILSFSSFPAILLITTLFRLALSISTSRLILNDADAGEIIATFGLFVIGDNIVVGFVIFAIVTIVQFLVITKGAERVAEVAARFSLDGMPGKQMSIDADLRAQAIDSSEATHRRTVLEKESQLYGSFDGAMKFIKGDAIAGIIVIFINFIGGISVGVSQHNMDMSTALSTYTMLTIGDGLVAQIPSLLIAISAGFIVTRVSGEGDNMGQTMMSQLFSNQFVLIIASIIALLIGILPGFPLMIFILLAMLPGGLCAYRWFQMRKTTSVKKSDITATDEVDRVTERSGTRLSMIENLDEITPVTVPLMLLTSPRVGAYLEELNAIMRFRSQFFVDYGIHLPEMVLRTTQKQADDTAKLLINEIEASEFTLHTDWLAVINGSDEIEQLGISTQLNENTIWVPAEHEQQLSELGFVTRSALDELYYCLINVLLLNVNEYFGVQETKSHLDRLEKDFPELIKEATRHASVQKISEIFQRLLSEKISVRNTKLIIETLTVWASKEKDIINLVEQVRSALSRYISYKFSTNGVLRVVMFSAEVEEVIRKNIRSTSGGVFLNLSPAEAEVLMDKIEYSLGGVLMSQKDYVIL
ncbi:EscV/YscV/HrcV family type III secretion system export apparatus protein, partial [Pantoea endophytica]